MASFRLGLVQWLLLGQKCVAMFLCKRMDPLWIQDLEISISAKAQELATIFCGKNWFLPEQKSTTTKAQTTIWESTLCTFGCLPICPILWASWQPWHDPCLAIRGQSDSRRQGRWKGQPRLPHQRHRRCSILRRTTDLCDAEEAEGSHDFFNFEIIWHTMSATGCVYVCRWPKPRLNNSRDAHDVRISEGSDYLTHVVDDMTTWRHDDMTTWSKPSTGYVGPSQDVARCRSLVARCPWMEASQSHAAVRWVAPLFPPLGWGWIGAFRNRIRRRVVEVANMGTEPMAIVQHGCLQSVCRYKWNPGAQRVITDKRPTTNVPRNSSPQSGRFPRRKPEHNLRDMFLARYNNTTNDSNS